MVSEEFIHVQEKASSTIFSTFSTINDEAEWLIVIETHNYTSRPTAAIKVCGKNKQLYAQYEDIDMLYGCSWSERPKQTQRVMVFHAQTP